MNQKKIQARVTEEEFASICLRAFTLNLTVSEYVRRRALEERITPPNQVRGSVLQMIRQRWGKK